MIKLAIFDLDNTLIAGDSDHQWGQFLVSKGVVNAEDYTQRNNQFYEDYRQGRLNNDDFLTFALAPLAENSMQQLQTWQAEFMQTIIEPLILPKAEALITQHRNESHTLLIITATNTFVADPIAKRLGIANLIATEPEIHDGRYTGRVTGTPSFREGKITRLQEWLTTRNETLEKSWFYSDSHNDIPLMQQVDQPIAVDPDEKLAEYANCMQWDIISLR